MKITSILATLAGFYTAAEAFNHNPLPVTRRSLITPSYIKNNTFNQLIDHENPEKGTFPQRYWYSSKWWAGPGSPVILTTPGEDAADDYTEYLTNYTLPGVLAEEMGGAVIMIEHRYFGNSTPYQNLTAETLQYLTVNQSIADLVHFAKTVDLAFDKNHSSNANNAPWVLTGGSYAGALTAWTQSISPGTFWAYHASSAVVEAVFDYWQYFLPIQEGLPKNCSRDISRVTAYIDHIHDTGNTTAQKKLKQQFGLGNLTHFDDFAHAISEPLGLWQSNSFYAGYNYLSKFCDSIENVHSKNSTLPSAQGVGLEKATEGYASYYKTHVLQSTCEYYGYPGNSTACLNTYDATNTVYAADGSDKIWTWMLCNEGLAWWQTGKNSSSSSSGLVSKLVSAEYKQRQCGLYFPETNGFTYKSARDGRVSVGEVNKWTGGWKYTNTTRLIWTNGQYDPWREATVSAKSRPGGPLNSTIEAPVQVIPGGFHCSDLAMLNGKHNAGVQKVIDNEVTQLKAWVDEFYY